MNIKTIIRNLLIGLWLAFLGTSNAQIRFWVVSDEQAQQNGILEINLRFHAAKDLTLQNPLNITLPENWQVLSVNKQIGDTVSFLVKIAYPVLDISFFPMDFSVRLSYFSTNDTINKGIAYADGKIYFTPYNTVEVFSEKDFHGNLAPPLGLVCRQASAAGTEAFNKLKFATSNITKFPPYMTYYYHYKRRIWSKFLN